MFGHFQVESNLGDLVLAAVAERRPKSRVGVFQSLCALNKYAKTAYIAAPDYPDHLS